MVVTTTKSSPMAQDLKTSMSSFTLPKTLKLKTKQQELLIRVATLSLIYVLAFITRLFSVLRYESMIHEFDPYFNYRTTLFLTRNGFAEFWNWFDSESWYPLGRIIGGTLYPGLMLTAAAMCSPDCTCWNPTNLICMASSIPNTYMQLYATYSLSEYLPVTSSTST